jgi:AcrR family transcriptional regulator
MAKRRKPAQVRGEAKREVILAAAWDVFREDGYPNASMDEITRRAGGSKVSVYAHFGSKAALFDAVVRWRAEAVAASYSAAQAQTASAEQALTALATAVVAGMTSSVVQDLHRVALSAQPGGAEIGKLLYEHGTLRVLRGVATVIELQMTSGELIADDPMAAAEELFGLLLGTGYIRFALGVPDRLTAAAKQKRIARAVRIFLAAYRSVADRGTLPDD